MPYKKYGFIDSLAGSATTSQMYEIKYDKIDFLKLMNEEKKDRGSKVSKNIKDEALNAIVNGGKKYFNEEHFLWITNTDDKQVSGDLDNLMRIGFDVRAYDVVNSTAESCQIPHRRGWYDVVITNYLEHLENDKVRANVIKFAMSCLDKVSERKLTLAVKKDAGIEKVDLIEIARYVGIQNSCIWDPFIASKMKDHICIAIK